MVFSDIPSNLDTKRQIRCKSTARNRTIFYGWILIFEHIYDQIVQTAMIIKMLNTMIGYDDAEIIFQKEKKIDHNGQLDSKK